MRRLSQLPKWILGISVLVTLVLWGLLPASPDSRLFLMHLLFYSWILTAAVSVLALGVEIKQVALKRANLVKLVSIVILSYLALLFLTPGVSSINMSGLVSLRDITGDGLNRGDVVWVDSSQAAYKQGDVVLLDWMEVMGGGWGPNFAIRKIMGGPSENIEIDFKRGTIKIRGKTIPGSVDPAVFKKFNMAYDGVVHLDENTYLVHRGDTVPIYVPAKRIHLPARICWRIPNIFHRLYPDVVY